MPKLELIYDHDCPNIAEARRHLMHAFAMIGQPPQWTEWDRSDPQSPDYVHRYGSPTILIDGKDLAGVDPGGHATCCRLYRDSAGRMVGAPPSKSIAAAMGSADPLATTSTELGRRWGMLAVLPGLGAALVPIGVCPACWPVYAGVLSAVGLGFMLETAYLLPVTSLLLLVAVFALGFRASTRHGHGPLVMGVIASGLIVTGKFAYASDTAMYLGVAMLTAAAVWNAWPRKVADQNRDSCPACAPGGQVSSSQKGASEVSS